MAVESLLLVELEAIASLVDQDLVVERLARKPLACMRVCGSASRRQRENV